MELVKIATEEDKGMPPKSCLDSRSVQSFSFTAYNVCAPSMLTSSMINLASSTSLRDRW
jgi:hypothetical protein